MFNKTSVPTQQRRPNDPVSPSVETTTAAARRPAAPRAASLLGPDLVIEGQITGEGELHIEGGVRGEIHVARLVIGEHAHVEGMIRGGQVEVRGRVIGNIEGKAVKLYETAHVEGDIIHEQLSIDVGAYFQGRCQQFQRPPAPVAKAEPAAPPVQAAPTARIIELDKSAQA
jgi:cytoskeletal protein CcmA (bactofilin family)